MEDLDRKPQIESFMFSLKKNKRIKVTKTKNYVCLSTKCYYRGN